MSYTRIVPRKPRPIRYALWKVADFFGFGRRDWALLDALGERWSRDQFHHQRTVLDAVNGCDAGVVELGQDFRFALEARQAIGVAG